MTRDTSCCVCGEDALAPHLKVAAQMGPEGLIPTTEQFGSALADIVRCQRCGHMQLLPMPTEETLDSAYEVAASGDYVEEQEGQRATAGRVLDEIETFKPAGRLLDLGCWVGFLLSEARERGWTVTGVEPSEFAAGYAKEHLGLEIHQTNLFTADLPSAAFDVVVLGDVIEHLPRPADALSRIASLLAPAGVVTMMLPDAGSHVARAMGKRWWSVIPTHVQFFTRSSMRTLLERNGWTVLYIGTQPKIFTVRYYLGRVGGYAPPLAAGLIKGAEAIGIADRVWGPDFRDRMLVIARRPV